ncbi:PepSY-associated TM helix domain-containing protein [Labedaea rhizosphaerae]|uniref:Putative iron-regulated membrane protein n=1 Tax=Labedaea rhizosphaerae TaxID=598644 RepID=A0A4R6S328_LABRH|nr:PepSY-associated TM helix domain-containing protein [Labedaea rhizosphaerae]TDP94002.1 putative iron-regulated membrane protein [Labedaea rhizosphaerae]
MTAEAPVDEELTRTEVAQRAPARGGRLRRWWRRRPVRRALVLTHRWTSLVLGLFLVVETTSGAVLLYHAELFRMTNPGFYQHTDSPSPVSLQQAHDIVAAAHPEFPAAWVSNDGGIIAVGDPTYATAYAVDPGTGHINGVTDLNGGVLGWLANLHDCAFTCSGYAGYASWLAATPPSPGFDWPEGTTWGALALDVLGLLMILLVVTGIITWWPGRKKLAHGFRVRTGKGRFARDYDLHNIIGIVSLPFILMWGVTGAAFYLPQVEKAWLAITGGSAPDEAKYSFAADPAPAGAPVLGIDQAAAVAVAHAPGEIRYLTTRQEGADYYSFSIAGTGYQPYGARAFFGGDQFVYVDGHDPDHVSVVDAKPQPAANTFYEKVFEPAHFGWLVNGWWRIIWFVLGLAPLALMVTALSTWLFRLGTKRRRRKAKAA